MEVDTDKVNCEFETVEQRASRIQSMIDQGHDFGETVYD